MQQNLQQDAPFGPQYGVSPADDSALPKGVRAVYRRLMNRAPVHGDLRTQSGLRPRSLARTIETPLQDPGRALADFCFEVAQLMGAVYRLQPDALPEMLELYALVGEERLAGSAFERQIRNGLRGLPQDYDRNRWTQAMETDMHFALTGPWENPWEQDHANILAALVERLIGNLQTLGTDPETAEALLWQLYNRHDWSRWPAGRST